MNRSKPVTDQSDDDAGVDFVTRWSRLKHASSASTEVPAADGVTAGTAAEERNPSAQKADSPVRILSDEDMPDIETLTADSAYGDFFSPGVSDKLRRLALRKLFQSEVFNIRDGLDEYDDDYTRFEKLGDIVTSDMRHQLDLEAQRQAQRLLPEKDPLSFTECESDKDMNHQQQPDEEDTSEPLNEAEDIKRIDQPRTLTAAGADDASLTSVSANSADPDINTRPEKNRQRSGDRSEIDADNGQKSGLKADSSS